MFRYMACFYTSCALTKPIYLFLILLPMGCAYSAHLGIRNNLANAADRTALITQLEEEKADSVDEVVRLLNLGMAYRIDGQYLKSIGKWEEAKRIIAEQRAPSITEGISSFLLNNTAESFSPSAIEEQNLHIFQAANFLDLGKPESARVEVVQREQLIKEYPSELRYPFADYFAGIVFEFNAEPDQALVSYRRAFDGYTRTGLPPESLLKDYARLLDYIGAHAELDELLAKNPVNYSKQPPNFTILVARGVISEKVEDRLDHFAPEYNSSFSIALPSYPPKQIYSPSTIWINTSPYNTYRASDIDSMVRYELAQSMDSLLAQAVARQIAKRALVNALSQGQYEPDESPFADLFLLTINASIIHVSEFADLRSWNSLPANIDIYRDHRAPGSYVVSVPPTEPITIELKNASQVLRLVHQIDA